MTLNPPLMHLPLSPLAAQGLREIEEIALNPPMVKFCNQCGKVFALAHADCRTHVPREFAAPPCPSSQVEYWHGIMPKTMLVCHLSIEKGWPETETDPAEPATATLNAAYLHGTNILEWLLSEAQIAEIEELALIEVLS